jgi:hypothetical protein
MQLCVAIVGQLGVGKLVSDLDVDTTRFDGTSNENGDADYDTDDKHQGSLERRFEAYIIFYGRDARHYSCDQKRDSSDNENVHHDLFLAILSHAKRGRHSRLRIIFFQKRCCCHDGAVYGHKAKEYSSSKYEACGKRVRDKACTQQTAN